eukprot:TRINITY_DN104175_c0_g1_i1.p1 TRINITY_DN104175_c0_g1~~TRINITY_DN104175_c0_g1_i1.p1  ORF type:complete len:124 (+),score=19.35 TRINITY_DN104175_c0_g1_i1:40-411(+)
MVSKSLARAKKKQAFEEGRKERVLSTQRDLPKPKQQMHPKRKWRLLGLAPTPGVYEGFEERGQEMHKCSKCGNCGRVQNFCVKCKKATGNGKTTTTPVMVRPAEQTETPVSSSSKVGVVGITN